MPLSSLTCRLAALLGAALLFAVPVTASAAAPRVTHGSAFDVVAPAPGTGVAMTAVMTNGASLELVVVTDLNGVTSVLDKHAPEGLAAALDRVAASPDACSDAQYAFPAQGRFR